MLAERESTEVARPLKVLVPLIQQEVERGYEAGIEYYRRAGQLLLEAKAQLEHGEWSGWLRRHFTLSQRSAEAYMKLAREVRANSQQPRFSTLGEVAYPRKKKAAWHAPVSEILRKQVHVKQLAQEQQNRQREARLVEDLGRQLIDIGYKVLATKLHPDTGGSAEAMARLNRVRERLRAAV